MLLVLKAVAAVLFRLIFGDGISVALLYFNFYASSSLVRSVIKHQDDSDIR